VCLTLNVPDSDEDIPLPAGPPPLPPGHPGDDDESPDDDDDIPMPKGPPPPRNADEQTGKAGLILSRVIMFKFSIPCSSTSAPTSHDQPTIGFFTRPASAYSIQSDFLCSCRFYASSAVSTDFSQW
jgi:hypothetical protein